MFLLLLRPPEFGLQMELTASEKLTQAWTMSAQGTFYCTLEESALKVSIVNQINGWKICWIIILKYDEIFEFFLMPWNFSFLVVKICYLLMALKIRRSRTSMVSTTDTNGRSFKIV